jgi:hypothetical protein
VCTSFRNPAIEYIKTAISSCRQHARHRTAKPRVQRSSADARRITRHACDCCATRHFRARRNGDGPGSTPCTATAAIARYTVIP